LKTKEKCVIGKSYWGDWFLWKKTKKRASYNLKKIHEEEFKSKPGQKKKLNSRRSTRKGQWMRQVAVITRHLYGWVVRLIIIINLIKRKPKRLGALREKSWKEKKRTRKEDSACPGKGWPACTGRGESNIISRKNTAWLMQSNRASSTFP